MKQEKIKDLVNCSKCNRNNYQTGIITDEDGINYCVDCWYERFD